MSFRTSTLAALVVLAACRLPVHAGLLNAISAIVHTSVITKEDVDSLDAQTAGMIERQYGARPEVFREKMTKARQENIEKLISDQLILHEFNKSGYSLPDSVVDEMVRERIRTKYKDRRTMTKTLQAEGITQERYRQRVRERVILDAMRQKHLAPEKIIVSPYKMEQYYLANRENYKVEEEAKLRVIVLPKTRDPYAASPLKLAVDVLTKLNEGVSFAEMATEISQGSQRSAGGDWGWWEKSRLTKGLSDIAFSLKVGQHSGVFSRSAGEDYWIYLYDNGKLTGARNYGVDPATKKERLIQERQFKDESDAVGLPEPSEFYLLLLEDRRPERYKPLADVRDEIEKNLLTQEEEKLLRRWIDQLKKNTFVKLYN